MYRKITDKEKLEIVECYKNGELIKNIASKFDHNRCSIRKILDKHLGKDRNSNAFYKITKEMEETVLALTETKKVPEIARILNIKIGIIKRIKQKNGIKTHFNSKYIYNHDYFENIDTPNKAYILGFLYADGCLLSSSNTVALVLQTRDREILEKIKEEIGTNIKLIVRNPHVISNTKYISSGSCGISLHSAKIRKDLENIGLTTKKSLTLKFPETLSESLYSHFIRGYFDGDGHISKPTLNVVCTVSVVGTFEFLTKVKSILDKQGIICKLTLEKRHKKVYYLISSSRAKALAFSEYIYKDAELYLKRKYEIFKEWKNLPYDKRQTFRRTYSECCIKKNNSI